MRDDEPEIPKSPAALPSVVVQSSSPASQRARSLTLDRRALEAGIATTTCPQCGQNPAPKQLPTVELSRVPWGMFAAASFSAWLAAIVWWFGRSAVRVRLPLCDDCLHAHQRGMMWRRIGVIGLAISPGPFIALLPLLAPELPPAMMLWSVMSVVGGVGCFAAFRRTRDTVLRLARRPNTREVQLLASSSFTEVVLRERPDAVR